MKHKKITISIIVILLLILGTGFFMRGRIREAYLDYKFQKIHNALPPEETAQEVIQKNNPTLDSATTSFSLTTPSISTSTKPKIKISVVTVTTSVVTSSSSSSSIPTSNSSLGINLKVPFTTQAPFHDWGMPYQEACEETAALMVHYFYEGKTFTPTIADEEIKAIVDYEKQTLGFYEDTTAEETAQFIRGLWGYTVEVRPASLEAIKQEVTLGYPVLLPTAGRELGNPFFKQPGPIYHMLVVRGYTKDGKIITNDAGIGRGQSYVYDENVLWNAIHDWNGGDVIHGEKLMIVIEPKK
jgi:hypothetical protein